MPTFNEAGNIADLIGRLSATGAPLTEVLFVDDSTDDTPSVIREVAGASQLPVRLLHRECAERTGGLSGAVLAGIAAARTPWVVVMDGDLQHPPEDVPLLLAATFNAAGTEGDLVVASRYLPGAGAGGLDGRMRRLVSGLSTRVAAALFPQRLAGVTDAMTGFFALRRAALDTTRLHPSGFKILLEILVSQPLRVAEVPFRFAARSSGESKASIRQGLLFGLQLLRLRTSCGLLRRVAAGPRMLRFALVGGANVLVDVAVFNLLLAVTGGPLTSKMVSSTVALISSWWMSRRWTFGDRPAGGWRQAAAFGAVSFGATGFAETCLLVSHYLLGLTSTAADNLSANGVGLLLGMLWRLWAYDKWVFPPARRVSARAPREAGAVRLARVVDLSDEVVTERPARPASILARE